MRNLQQIIAGGDRATGGTEAEYQTAEGPRAAVDLWIFSEAFEAGEKPGVISYKVSPPGKQQVIRFGKFLGANGGLRVAKQLTVGPMRRSLMRILMLVGSP